MDNQIYAAALLLVSLIFGLPPFLLLIAVCIGSFRLRPLRWM